MRQQQIEPFRVIQTEHHLRPLQRGGHLGEQEAVVLHMRRDERPQVRLLLGGQLNLLPCHPRLPRCDKPHPLRLKFGLQLRESAGSGDEVRRGIRECGRKFRHVVRDGELLTLGDELRLERRQSRLGPLVLQPQAQQPQHGEAEEPQADFDGLFQTTNGHE